MNENLAKSNSIYDRKLFIVFCSKIAPKVSKKYFKEVFAFALLKLIDERKKDIAITFANHVIEIRKKLDDISSTRKIENTLNTLKSVFYKDNYIKTICTQAYSSITTSQFKAELKSNSEMQNEKNLQMEEQQVLEKENYQLKQDKINEKASKYAMPIRTPNVSKF